MSRFIVVRRANDRARRRSGAALRCAWLQFRLQSGSRDTPAELDQGEVPFRQSDAVGSLKEFRHPVTLRPGRALSGLGLMDLLGAILLVVCAVALTVYLILLES